MDPRIISGNRHLEGIRIHPTRVAEEDHQVGCRACPPFFLAIEGIHLEERMETMEIERNQVDGRGRILSPRRKIWIKSLSIRLLWVKASFGIGMIIGY